MNDKKYKELLNRYFNININNQFFINDFAALKDSVIEETPKELEETISNFLNLVSELIQTEPRPTPNKYKALFFTYKQKDYIIKLNFMYAYNDKLYLLIKDLINDLKKLNANQFFIYEGVKKIWLQKIATIYKSR